RGLQHEILELDAVLARGRAHAFRRILRSLALLHGVVRTLGGIPLPGPVVYHRGTCVIVLSEPTAVSATAARGKQGALQGAATLPVGGRRLVLRVSSA